MLIATPEDKRRARQALNYAVRTGKIDRGAWCELCGSSDGIEGHHADYSRPLHVQWLCRSCHAVVEGVEVSYAGELLGLSTADYKTNLQRAQEAFR